MGKQEFARLLENIVNDAEVAERVAGGDFAGADLTEAEQALLGAAAADLDDDVSGFGASGYYLKLGDIDGESWKVEEGEGLKIEFTPRVRSAFGYLKIGDIKGE